MRFFFYGTLIAGSGNAVAARLHAKLKPGSAGHAVGRLYAVADVEGWYPAFLPDPAGAPVHGMIHESAPHFAAEDLAAIDAYEGYRPDAPHSSEFVRRVVTVHMAGTGLCREAEAYVWAGGRIEELLAIPGGDFRAFLAERGGPGFGAGAR